MDIEAIAGRLQTELAISPASEAIDAALAALAARELRDRIRSAL